MTLHGGSQATDFPLGAAITLDALEDPHAHLAALREREPVSWVPALGAWLVTRRDLALMVMRDPATFTVEDERFSTSRVVGASMLSLDGAEHDRHRAPFAQPFRLDAVRSRFTEPVGAEAGRLIAALRPAGRAELRTAFAGPLAAAVITRALGLGNADVAAVLDWYAAIVGSVTALTAGEPAGAEGPAAFAGLRDAIGPALDAGPEASLLAAAAGAAGTLTREEVVSNAAVLLFGGIETTEGMIATAAWHLLSHPDQRAPVEADPGLLAGAVEESLRLEPAAASVDRYATGDVQLGGARIARGDLVIVSVTAANRDPATFPDPDAFDARRANARLHLAFAAGPHVCIGMHLARLEAQAALGCLLDGLPGLRLDPDRRSPGPRGLVFRKPAAVSAVWHDGAHAARHDPTAAP